jgi:hypothetical protein
MLDRVVILSLIECLPPLLHLLESARLGGAAGNQYAETGNEEQIREMET